MARIDLPDHLLPGFVPGLQGPRTEGRRKTERKKGVFSSLLREAGETEEAAGAEGALEPFSEEALSELLDEVHSLGDALRKNQGLEAVAAYKRAVRNFVHYVVERAFGVEEKTSGKSILKRKKFTMVAVIDERLERLAAEILSSQRDQMEILRRIDEINGMLVDLTR